MRITHSELRLFKRCRRSWYLSYYRNLAPIAVESVGPRPLGTKVHYALERYYGYREDPLVQLDFLIENDVLAFPETEEGIRKDGSLARIMVEGYVDWVEETGIDSDLEVIDTEKALEAPFATIRGVDISLLGKLDVRLRRVSDGAKLVLDHKTCQNFGDLTSTLHLDEQCLHYLLLERLLAQQEFGGAFDSETGSGWTDGALYNMLRKVKRTARANPPFYMREEVRHNTDELRSYWKRVYGQVTNMVGLRQALDNGGDPAMLCYPTPRKDCSWDCDFFQICGQFDDGSDVESVIEDVYVVSDPHQRYADAAAKGETV